MNRRTFLEAVLPGWPGRRSQVMPRRFVVPGAEARRPDRLGLVRQGRPLPADPGGPRRGGLALRRRHEDARRGRRDRRRPARPRRRSRGPTPTTARCSAEKDLDIVLIATPDHWHALPMIAAVEAGADVYVQKPISVDVAEGQAMVAAARKHRRVVQVGTQRRSTPHLDRGPRPDRPRGQARQDRPGRDLLLLSHAK